VLLFPQLTFLWRQKFPLKRCRYGAETTQDWRSREKPERHILRLRAKHQADVFDELRARMFAAKIMKWKLLKVFTDLWRTGESGEVPQWARHWEWHRSHYSCSERHADEWRVEGLVVRHCGLTHINYAEKQSFYHSLRKLTHPSYCAMSHVMFASLNCGSRWTCETHFRGIISFIWLCCIIRKKLYSSFDWTMAQTEINNMGEIIVGKGLTYALKQGCQTHFPRGPHQHHGRPLKGPVV